MVKAHCTGAVVEEARFVGMVAVVVDFGGLEAVLPSNQIVEGIGMGSVVEAVQPVTKMHRFDRNLQGPMQLVDQD